MEESNPVAAGGLGIGKGLADDALKVGVYRLLHRSIWQLIRPHSGIDRCILAVALHEDVGDP